MKTLTKTDIEEFKTAVFKDQGIELNDNEANAAAVNLLGFINQLIEYAKADGYKIVQDKGLTKIVVELDNKLDRKK